MTSIQAGRTRPRVLLVDDQVIVGRALARLLEPHAHVVTASSAEEAAELLPGGGFHAVITDYQMAPNNGVWLLREVQRELPEARRVLISGVDPPAVEDHLATGLVHVFMRKPLRREELVAALVP